MTTKEEIADILDIQQKIYRDAVSMLFSSVNQRVDDQCKMLQELRTSLEFSQSEIVCLKQDLIESKKEIEDSKKLLYEQSITMKALYSKIDKLETYSRRNNVRIDGLTELNNENYQQTQKKVDCLFKEKLQLKNVKIETAHRLPRSNLNARSQPRTIIAKLTSIIDKDETMKNKHKLKGTGIFINEDLSEGTIKTRQEKLPELQAARNAGKIAYFRRDKLIVKETKYDNTRERIPVSTTASPATSAPPEISAPPTTSVTPSHSNVSTLIQTFTPQLENNVESTIKPLELGNSEGSIESDRTKNDDADQEERQQRNLRKNRKK